MEEWDLMCKRNGWNAVDMRDNRYDQVIHMVRTFNSQYSLMNKPIK